MIIPCHWYATIQRNLIYAVADGALILAAPDLTPCPLSREERGDQRRADRNVRWDKALHPLQGKGGGHK
jgi:hypothetical protein